MLNDTIRKINDQYELLKMCSSRYLGREIYAAIQGDNINHALLMCIVLEEKLTKKAKLLDTDVTFNGILEVTGRR